MAVRTRPMVDASIATMLRANNKILVTRNIADFVDMGVEIVNPWEIRRYSVTITFPFMCGCRAQM